MVGSLQGLDVAAPSIAGVHEVFAAPGESFTLQINGEQVRCHAAKAAVAVWEWMDHNQAVVEADCNLVSWVCLRVDPEPRVLEEDAQVGCDIPVVYAKIALRFAKSARPPPDVAEHAAVEVLQGRLVEYVALAPEGPLVCGEDVSLFGLVQFQRLRTLSFISFAARRLRAASSSRGLAFTPWASRRIV